VNTFFDDLKRGITVEQTVLLAIQRKYPCAVLVNRHKGYDIWIPETHKSVEVKYDPMSNKTGNIVIEIEMYDKPSALMSTTADYWVFYDDNIFVVITPKEIVRCIFNLKLQYVEFTAKGDSNNKKAFLVPKVEIFRYGKQLKIIED